MRAYKDQLVACTKMFKELGEKAGLTTKYSFRPHLLRHTKATLIYRMTKDFNLLKEEIQQKTLSATAGYASLCREDREDDPTMVDIKQIRKEYAESLYA
jgi:integrase